MHVLDSQCDNQAKMDTKTTYNNLSREEVESDDQSNSSSINYNSGKYIEKR